MQSFFLHRFKNAFQCGSQGEGEIRNDICSRRRLNFPTFLDLSAPVTSVVDRPDNKAKMQLQQKTKSGRSAFFAQKCRRKAHNNRGKSSKTLTRYTNSYGSNEKRISYTTKWIVVVVVVRRFMQLLECHYARSITKVLNVWSRRQIKSIRISPMRH